MAAQSDAAVLLSGPTGSGKTSLARMIHDGSARAGKPFVHVNLATLHEGTLESELFGHERGAFTGADNRRVGRLEAAQGGTVFLDEIGELSPRLQARLLEFLQSKVIIPVGSNRELRLNVRVIVATHRDLDAAVASGAFREDLFHRLRVLQIHLKSLIDRADEFDQLVHDCLDSVCRTHNCKVLRISEDVARMLEAYKWPGNFRELHNVLEFAVIACEDQEIRRCDLPVWFCEKLEKRVSSFESFIPVSPVVPSALLGVAELELSMNYQTAIANFEKTYLQRALNRFGGRVNYTARRIGMNKTTLLRRIRSHGLTAGAPV
jgi:DNA-binding NtrC family response regulator